MYHLNPLFRLGVVASAAGLALFAVLASAGEKEAPREKSDKGKFVSFQDGTLTLKSNLGELLETKIPAAAKTSVWNESARQFKPTDTTEALQQAPVGAYVTVRVTKENVTVRIGAGKGGKGMGTFVSYEDERLLMLAKNLSPQALKLYGDTVHFPRFFDDVPVYKSIDGGEYQLVGTPSTVLSKVKEGTVIITHNDTEDNIVLIQIGVPEKK